MVHYVALRIENVIRYDDWYLFEERIVQLVIGDQSDEATEFATKFKFIDV